MTGFEPGYSGIVSDRSANCATTTSQLVVMLRLCIHKHIRVSIYYHLFNLTTNPTTDSYSGFLAIVAPIKIAFDAHLRQLGYLGMQLHPFFK